MKVDGKVAVVVGGASGMARATAEELKGAGAKIAILDLPTSKGQETADELGDGTAGRRPTTSSSVPVSFAELESRYPEFLAAKK